MIQSENRDNPRRVLLIEDHEDDYVIVRDLLWDIAPTGFDLKWINNYHDAREALTHDQFDVCLLDYRLGEATGVDLVREFGKGETPFILFGLIPRSLLRFGQERHWRS